MTAPSLKFSLTFAELIINVGERCIGEQSDGKKKGIDLILPVYIHLSPKLYIFNVLYADLYYDS